MNVEVKKRGTRKYQGLKTGSCNGKREKDNVSCLSSGGGGREGTLSMGGTLLLVYLEGSSRKRN